MCICVEFMCACALIDFALIETKSVTESCHCTVYHVLHMLSAVFYALSLFEPYHRVDRFTVKCLLTSQTKHFFDNNFVSLNFGFVAAVDFTVATSHFFCCYLQAGLLAACCTGEYFCWHLITFNRSIHCISIKFFAAFKKCCSCCFFFIRRNQVSRAILSNKFVSKMISRSSRSIELLSKLKLFQTIQWCIDFSTYANIFCGIK